MQTAQVANGLFAGASRPRSTDGRKCAAAGEVVLLRLLAARRARGRAHRGADACAEAVADGREQGASIRRCRRRRRSSSLARDTSWARSSAPGKGNG